VYQYLNGKDKTVMLKIIPFFVPDTIFLHLRRTTKTKYYQEMEYQPSYHFEVGFALVQMYDSIVSKYPKVNVGIVFQAELSISLVTQELGANIKTIIYQNSPVPLWICEFTDAEELNLFLGF